MNLSIPTLQPMPYSQNHEFIKWLVRTSFGQKSTLIARQMACANQLRIKKSMLSARQVACANQLWTKIHAERSSNGLCEPASDFFLKKEKKKKEKSEKEEKREKRKQMEKRPQRLKGVPLETGRKIEFLKRNVKRSRNEIEAAKKIRFRAPDKKKKQTKTIKEKK